MWYVIPFVILLVVAIILKKREDNNKNSAPEKNKKTANKRTAKQPVQRKARSNSSPIMEHTPAVANTGSNSGLAAVPVTDELKAHIEHLIQLGNYTVAEAKINQALNQNNQQHELYSYLIELHTLQHDEFALKQLSNYLRSINLYYLADEANEKREALQQISNLADVVSSPLNETPRVSHRTGVNVSITNFDALARERAAKTERQEKAAAQSELPSQSSTFLFETEQLPHPLHVEQEKSDAATTDHEVAESAPTEHFVFSSEQLDNSAAQAHATEHVTEASPTSEQANVETTTETANAYELDFFLEESTPAAPQSNASISSDQAPTAAPADVAHQPLEFDRSELQLEKTVTSTAPTSSSANENHQDALDFDFDLASPIPAVKALDLESATPAQAKEAITSDEQGLDFSFDLSEEWGKAEQTSTQALEAELLKTPVQPESSTVVDAPLDFDLDFSSVAVADSIPVSTSAAVSTEPQLLSHEDFRFDLDQPATTTAPSAPKRTLNLTIDNPVDDTVPDLVFDFDVQESSPAPTAEAAEHSTDFIESTSSTANADPLTQSFPELLQIDENQLSLDLAAQYIKLGAYADAKALLQENQPKFNEQQREIATKLLREIDS